jgi:branched-chain amino acid transport system substrate-binding protein
MRRASPFLTPALLVFLALSQPAAADILIGVAGPMSGANAMFGDQMKRGAQMAVDDLNRTGGLGGERLALQFADDGCDPRKAVDAATALVSVGVKAVVGHFCSGAAIPAAKIYDQAGIVEISPSASNPKLTDEGGWNVIRLAARDDAQAATAGRYIAAHFGGKKIALLGDGSASSEALLKVMRTTLQAAGQSATIDESYKPGGKDFADLARRIIDAQADVVYFSGNYPESAYIIKALRLQGSQAQFVGSDSLVTDEFWAIAREQAEGTIMTFGRDPQTFDAARDLVQRFQQAGFNPEGATIPTYAAAQTFVQAAEATGGTDGHRIAQWLRAGNKVTTVLGELRFNARGDLADPPVAWFRWSLGHYSQAPDIQ